MNSAENYQNKNTEIWNKEYLEDNDNPYFSEAASGPNELESPKSNFTSPNFACRFYLHEIEREGKMPDVLKYLDDVENRDCHEFSSAAEVNEETASYEEALSDKLDHNDKSALKHYTGFDYKYINQVARGFWNYNILGRKTLEKEAEARESADAIDAAISKSPKIGFNFHAYRGANLDTFRDYKVETIQDLYNLKNQFFLEPGFTSTSMQKKSSFIGRDYDDPLRTRANVEIRYFIPAESTDGVALLSDDLSYSPDQQEYLINRDSLFYIKDVDVDEDNIAHLDMVLIPEKCYN